MIPAIPAVDAASAAAGPSSNFTSKNTRYSCFFPASTRPFAASSHGITRSLTPNTVVDGTVALRPPYIHLGCARRCRYGHKKQSACNLFPNPHRFSLELTRHTVYSPPSAFAASCCGLSPRRICGPVVAVSVSPSAEIQIAAASASDFTIAFPFAGPTSSSVVDSASDAVPVFATMLSAYFVFNGFPLSGSMMCPAVSIPTRLAGVCSDVDTLFSRNITCGSMWFDGSRKCTSHALFLGGAPIP